MNKIKTVPYKKDKIEKPPEEEYGTLKNYVDGEWRESETGEYNEIKDPATMEPIFKAPKSTKDELEEAIESAEEAFGEWRSTPPVDRARYMHRLTDIMEDNFEFFAKVLTQEMGKTLYDSRGEVRRAIENVETAAGIPSLQQGDFSVDIARDIDEYTVKMPLGVFGSLNPYNFPFMVPFWFLPFCIATGNTMVLKPSSRVPNSMQQFFKVIDEELDLPDGVLNLVNIPGSETDPFYDHDGVKGITFVGSTPVAEKIYSNAGDAGMRALCQAGALCFSVLTESAEMDTTCRSSLTSFYGCTGQRCLSNQVFLVHSDRTEEFKEKMTEYSESFATGYGLDERVQMGPFVDKAAKEKTMRHIESALDDGMEMVLDGRDIEVEGLPEDCFLGPTIMEGLEMDMDVAHEEIFGPVMLIKEIDSLDEAIEIINEHEKGNATTIYTEEGSEARKFRHEINIGNVGINVGIVAPMAFFPFGGTKESFYGVLHGQRESIDFFTDRQVVIKRWFK